MTKERSSDLPEQESKKEELLLPSFSNCFESLLSKGELLEVSGTNVVRVPFGIRQPKKQRPARANNWATLVLPLQTVDSPSPPPHAA